jgi:hypothetical protein
MGVCELDSSEQGPVMGSCEHGNEPSSTLKYYEFLGWCNKYYLLKPTLFHGIS